MVEFIHVAKHKNQIEEKPRLVERLLYLSEREAVSFEGEVPYSNYSLPSPLRVPEKLVRGLRIPLPELKIYQFMLGAALCEKAKTGESLYSRVKLLTPSGVCFDYVNTTQAALNG